MKGLLLKDFYLLIKYCRAFLLIAVIFVGVSVFSYNTFFLYFPCVLFGVLPMTLQSYDEREKWTLYSGTFPYSRAQLVSAKYLLGLTLTVLLVLLTTAAQAIRMTLNPDYLCAMAIFVLATGLLSPAILLPFVFRFGAEKARIVYYCVVGLVFCCTGQFWGQLSAISLSFVQITVSWVFAASAVPLYALSWLLSIAFYKKREM